MSSIPYFVPYFGLWIVISLSSWRNLGNFLDFCINQWLRAKRSRETALLCGRICDKQLMDITHRPRRNRRSAVVRNLVAETSLHTEQLIFPLFLCEGTG